MKWLLMSLSFYMWYEEEVLTCVFTEYHNKTITKLFNGNSLYGCYALAVTIFSLGIIRDYMYVKSNSDLYAHNSNLQ